MVTRAKLEEAKFKNHSTKFCGNFKSTTHTPMKCRINSRNASQKHCPFFCIKGHTYDECRKKQNEERCDIKQVEKNNNEAKPTTTARKVNTL